MKRGGPLPRHTPMPRPTQPLARVKPLRQVVVLHERISTRHRNTGPVGAVKAIVAARSGDLCELCKAAATNIHHRLPRQMGGTSNPLINAASNLLHICGSGVTGCHGHIESERAEGYRLGHLVHAGQDPRAVPVFLYDHGWCLLADDGSVTPCPPPDRSAA